MQPKIFKKKKSLKCKTHFYEPTAFLLCSDDSFRWSKGSGCARDQETAENQIGKFHGILKWEVLLLTTMGKRTGNNKCIVFTMLRVGVCVSQHHRSSLSTWGKQLK